MWTYETTPIAQNGLQYHIYQKGRALNFDKVIYNWAHQPEFRQFYNQLLADAPFEAFYWEHPALVKNDQDKIYEFVLFPADVLSQVAAEPHHFQEHFSPHKTVVSFDNLGGDANLVVPCPVEGKSYPHLARFVRDAPEEQVHAFWAMVGENYEKSLGAKPTWLSTAGLGVHWLHVRIDSRPKYYKTMQYKHQ